jgi:hypothetical protein
MAFYQRNNEFGFEGFVLFSMPNLAAIFSTEIIRFWA